MTLRPRLVSLSLVVVVVVVVAVLVVCVLVARYNALQMTLQKSVWWDRFVRNNSRAENLAALSILLMEMEVPLACWMNSDKSVERK